jgi:hypothetical protein
MRGKGVAHVRDLRVLFLGVVSLIRTEYLKLGLRVLLRFKVRVGLMASSFLEVSGVIRLGLV